MKYATIISVLIQITGAVAKCVFFAFVLPLAAALLSGIPATPVLALIGTTFIIEYGAAPVGTGLGLPPLFVFLVLTCVASGVILALFDLFDSLGEHSERVGRFLKRSRKRAEGSEILSRYGMYGLVLVVLTLGFYVCPPVSWVMGWDRNRSIALIMAGYCGISLILILATMGFLNVFFP